VQRNICPYCQRASYTSEGRGRVTICPYCGSRFLTGAGDQPGDPIPDEAPGPARHHPSFKAREGS